MLQAEKGHVDVVNYLVEHRVDVSRSNVNGVSPLWIACQDNHVDVVEHQHARPVAWRWAEGGRRG